MRQPTFQDLLHFIAVLLFPSLLLLSCSPQSPEVPDADEDTLAGIAGDDPLSLPLETSGGSDSLIPRFRSEKPKIDPEWPRREETIGRRDGLGRTKLPEMHPLIDFHVSDESLRANDGVWYLVHTDSAILLFDVGLN